MHCTGYYINAQMGSLQKIFALSPPVWTLHGLW